MQNKHKPKYHSFSKDLATKYGYRAAILLQYLADRISKAPKKADDKEWCRINTRTLAEKCPYLKATTIFDVLNKLRDAQVLQIDEHNRRKLDFTRWYAFADPNVYAEAESTISRLKFLAQDAQKYGVVAAVLIQNIAHWVRKHRETDPAYLFHKMSATHLADKILPFSRTQITDALDLLVKRKVLKSKKAAGFDQSRLYRLADEQRLDGNFSNTHLTNPNTHGSKANAHGGKLRKLAT